MRKLFFVVLMGISFLSHAVNTKTYIPPRAFELRDLLYHEINTQFPNIPTYSYIPSLVEHESCISLTNKRCWSPTSTLKTSRELGVGYFQLTKTYRSDGTVRFDTVKDLRNTYIKDLKDLSWENIYQRPDLQLRAGILLVRQTYKGLYAIKDPMVRLEMTDSGFNGGLGGVYKDRRLCSLMKGCDPDIWFGNVEKACTKSKKVLYGTRSACDINRFHVTDVFENKIPKYQKLYFDTKYLEDKAIALDEKLNEDDTNTKPESN